MSAAVRTVSPVAEIDEFFAVEGIDAYFIGPVDLAKSVGHRGDFRPPEVQAVIDDIIDRGRAAGRHVGILADAGNAADYVAKGVRFLYTHANDFIGAGARAFARRVGGVRA